MGPVAVLRYGNSLAAMCVRPNTTVAWYNGQNEFLMFLFRNLCFKHSGVETGGSGGSVNGGPSSWGPKNFMQEKNTPLLKN